MTQREYDRKLAELERLLNDPATPLDAHRVWALLADIAGARFADPAASGTPPHATVLA